MENLHPFLKHKNMHVFMYFLIKHLRAGATLH